MKLTKEQELDIKKKLGDNEVLHITYDDLIESRLNELDPEFVQELKKAFKGTTFWYA